METPVRHPMPVAVLALAALIAPVDSPAAEIQAGVAAAGLRIIGPADVLRDYCKLAEDGSLWLKLPGGQAFELVTSTKDAAIANPGDGSFHPFDEDEVREALAEVRYPIAGLRAEVYLLPYPRRASLESAAGPGLILLSPGVAPMPAERQHAEFIHELGHVVQYQWLPDGDERWAHYRSRRGIEDLSRFSASSHHANRPHEIFAEDFRALFGGTQANYSGSIENPELQHPAHVPGLDLFLRSLPEGVPGAARLRAGVNPARGPLSFAIAGAHAAPLDLFDVSGRRIATLEPQSLGAQTLWRWDGRDSGGRTAPRGMILARVRGANGAATRLSWLP